MRVKELLKMKEHDDYQDNLATCPCALRAVDFPWCAEVLIAIRAGAPGVSSKKGILRSQSVNLNIRYCSIKFTICIAKVLLFIKAIFYWAQYVFIWWHLCFRTISKCKKNNEPKSGCQAKRKSHKKQKINSWIVSTY